MSWSGHLSLLPLSVIFPGIWINSKTRLKGYLIAFSYYTGAIAFVSKDIAAYFNMTQLFGLMIGIAAAMIQSIPFGIGWNHHKKTRMIIFVLIMIAMIVPPIGIVGWANPITSAGVIFPGWSWLGLALTVCLMILIGARYYWSIIPIIIMVITTLSPPTVTTPEGWGGMNTSYRYEDGRNYLKDYERQIEIIENLKQTYNKVVVLPESSGSVWTQATQALWERSDLDQTIYLNAELKKSKSSESVLVKISDNESTIVYRQRMPVPITMWNPFQRDMYKAKWIQNTTETVEGKRLGFLICYEQYLVWPILDVMRQNPDVLVGMSNLWWAKDSQLSKGQDMVLTAWSRLMGTELVLSKNQ